MGKAIKNSIIYFVLYPNEKGGNLWLKIEAPLAPGSVPEPKIGYGHNF